MGEGDKIDQDPGAAGELVPTQNAKRQPYTHASRRLTEKELSNPASIQFLISEIERLNHEVEKLDRFRIDFHETDKRADILEIRLRESKSKIAIFDVCLAVGAALLGLTPGIWEQKPYGWILLVFGGILVVASVMAKVAKT